MYCAMAFDKKQDVTSLCSNDSDDSLFVWSKQTIAELNNKKDGNMQRMQLNAVANLWEMCYDLLLATDENVSVSPGFEAFGLRVNKKYEYNFFGSGLPTPLVRCVDGQNIVEWCLVCLLSIQ